MEEFSQRLEKLEDKTRMSINQLSHTQRMFSTDIRRDFFVELDKIRNEVSSLLAKMATVSEIQELKVSVERLETLVQSGALRPANSNDDSSGSRYNIDFAVADRLNSLEEVAMVNAETIQKLTRRIDKLKNDPVLRDIQSRLQTLEHHFYSDMGMADGERLVTAKGDAEEENAALEQIDEEEIAKNMAPKPQPETAPLSEMKLEWG